MPVENPRQTQTTKSHRQADPPSRSELPSIECKYSALNDFDDVIEIDAAMTKSEVSRVGLSIS